LCGDGLGSAPQGSILDAEFRSNAGSLHDVNALRLRCTFEMRPYAEHANAVHRGTGGDECNAWSQVFDVWDLTGTMKLFAVLAIVPCSKCCTQCSTFRERMLQVSPEYQTPPFRRCLVSCTQDNFFCFNFRWHCHIVRPPCDCVA
jgi:hypothetical protein